MRRLLFCLFLAVPFASLAAPDAMQRVGSAKLRMAFMSIYDATLYAPDGKYDPEQPHALELKYRMDFTADEIIDRSIDEIKKAQSISAENEKRWRKELANVIPNVKENDRLRAIATPEKSLEFTFNGKPKGVVNDATLVGPFMAIWLGEKTSEPGMRAKLLGK